METLSQPARRALDGGFDAPVLLARLEAAWERSDRVFSLLSPEAMYMRPIALRQPFIFYLGHLPAFGWNQVCRGLLGRQGPEPELDDLFARGIDPVGVDRYEPDRPEQWPDPARVLAYRDRVRASLRDSLAAVGSLAAEDVLAENGRVYHLVIEHELMHHETLLYMAHQLEPALLRKPEDLPPYVFDGAALPGRVRISGGDVRLGERFEQVPFGWDNEFPEHLERVEPFEIDRTPVRNRDWLAFLQSGGYERQELWTPDAWAWKQRIGHVHPVFWAKRDGEWRYRTLFDELPLARVGDWPVYTSWAEAAAYARWRGAELPTEAEFHAAADEAETVWGARAPGNLDFRNWAPVPVGSGSGAADRSRDGAPGAGRSEGDTSGAALDLVGNGWEWTGTPFGPVPGFTAWARTYPGYSADFFDTAHYVMLGASWATDAALVRRSFRNWFQPHYPFVYAKFRCVWR
jgi:ergothioneine biosynthesis protein EgtB